MFKEEREAYRFGWKDLGDIAGGRPNLGPHVSVTAYRLMQYTLHDVLITMLGTREADHILYEAGRLAGMEFCANVLDRRQGLDAFLAEAAQVLAEEKVAVLRVETADPKTLEMTLTLSEDLECSGLPASSETICTYDAGLVAGMLQAWAGRAFTVREVDCWASGARTCRFRAAAIW